MTKHRCIDVHYHTSVDSVTRNEIEQRLSVVGHVGANVDSGIRVVVHVGLSGHIGYRSSLDFYIDGPNEISSDLIAEIADYFSMCETRVLVYLGKFPCGGADIDGGSQLARQLIDVLKCRSLLDVCFIRKTDQEFSDNSVQKISYVPYINPLGDKFVRRLENLETNVRAIRNGKCYDVIVAAHCSKFFGLSEDDELMRRSILFPMFLTKSYERAGECVPVRYTEMERSVLRSVSSIVTPSSDEKDDIVLGYGVDQAKISVIPRGIDSRIRPIARIVDGVRLISIGSIKKQKNHIGEIAVLSILHKLGVKASLTMVGNVYDQEERISIAKAESEAGLTGCVRIVSGLSRQEIAQELETHTFGISTSKWETFGRGIFECLASGLPTVVSSSLKTVRDYLQGNGGAIFCETPERMANAILQLWQDRLAYKTASLAAASIASRFSSGVEEERLLYQILLDRTGYRSRFTSWYRRDAEEIYNGRYSFCLRIGDRVRKYIRFDNQMQVEREFDIAVMAYKAGINTPKPYYTGWDCRYRLFYIESEYLGGSEILMFSKKDCSDVMDAVAIVQSFTDKFPVTADMSNFKDAIKACDEHFGWCLSEDLSYLDGLKAEVLVHGDLWTQNMRRGKDGRIVFYDFQSAALGPQDWDWCYVLANSRPGCFPPAVIRSVRNDRCRGMIRLIHKIRIGRAICKGLPIDNLVSVMHDWDAVYDD